MACAFGVDVLDKRLPYLEKGQYKELDMGTFLRKTFNFLTFRGARPEVMIWPYILLFMYRQEDKEWLKNVKTIRDFAEQLVLERKKALSLS